MVRMMILALFVAVLLGCGVFGGTDEVALTSPTPMDGPPPSAGPPAAPIAPVPDYFFGDTLVEQKILDSDIIVRALMTSFSAEIAADNEGEYRAVMKFNLNVREYLKGEGESSIVAVWISRGIYLNLADAERWKISILERRDARFDDREAIIFLNDYESNWYATLIDEFPQSPNQYFVPYGFSLHYDYRFGIDSESNRVWLPAASAGPTGDDSEFLLAVPSLNSPTITLADLKMRVAEIIAELNAGDGSLAYEWCVESKYEDIRRIRFYQDVKGEEFYTNDFEGGELMSGQAAGAELYERYGAGIYPDQTGKTWFEGEYADLLYVELGKTTPEDVDDDGKFTAGIDEISFTETFKTTRPLPSGVYRIERKDLYGFHAPCNHVIDYATTITVNPPDGALHEAFFDPAQTADGIGADGNAGVLKPATFAINETTEIERIEWKSSGVVEMVLNPSVSLAGLSIDFIELDGSTALSLGFDEAKSSGGALSWSARERPWDAGDLLMIRIREGGGGAR